MRFMDYSLAIVTSFITVFTTSIAHSQTGVRSYNDQTSSTTTAKVLEPRTIEEAVAFIKTAAQNGTKLRLSGASHSTSSLILGDADYLSTKSLNRIGNIESLNGETTITVEAGVRLGQLAKHLDKHGYSFGFAFPAYQDLTIGGVIATGSHGSSRRHVAISSQAVREVSLINGYGELVQIDARSPQLFKAAKTSLGLLGAIVELKIKIEPQFNLEMKTSVLADETRLLQDHEVNFGSRADYNAIAWFPYNNTAISFAATKTSTPAMNEGENVTLGTSSENSIRDHFASFLLKYGRQFNVLNQIAEYFRVEGLKSNPPFVFKNDGKDVHSETVVAPSHRITLSRALPMSSLYTLYDYSFSFPESEAFAVLSTVRDFSRRHNYRFPMTGVYLRFASSDGGSYVSHVERPGQGVVAYVVAEFLEYKPYGLGAPEATDRDTYRNELIDLLISKHKVVFHWGKNQDSIFSRSKISETYGKNLSEFLAEVRRMDPKEMFGSSYLSKLLSEPNRSH